MSARSPIVSIQAERMWVGSGDKSAKILFEVDAVLAPRQRRFKVAYSNALFPILLALGLGGWLWPDTNVKLGLMALQFAVLIVMLWGMRISTKRALVVYPQRWPQLQRGLSLMWRAQPNYTKLQLARIRLPVTIADGEYDEIIKAEHTKKLADQIPNARLSILTDVSHFAMLQDPAQFTRAIHEFLLRKV
jgi:pimeloyl-ACP methyl ester carboxylesterase